MKILFRSTLFTVLQFLIFNGLFAQSSILDAYIEEALQNNLSLKSELLQKEKQYAKLEQAKKLWGFQANMDASYLLAEGGRTIAFPIGDLFNPVNGALNSLTNSNNFPTNLENQNIQLTPNNFLDLQLSISKPILNSSIKYNQLIQKELIRLYDLSVELNKEDIVFQIKSAYYNYLKSFEALNILAETKKLLNDILAFNKKLIKYDKATLDILSDVEFQIANLESQKATVLEQQAIAKAYFNLLLDKALDSEIIIDENIISNEINSIDELSSLKSKAVQTRLEFKKLDVASAVNTLNQKRIDKEKLPTLGASAGIGLQTESFDFDAGGPLYTVALGMSWNIFDGGLRKKKIEEIQIDQKILNNQRKQLTQQVELELTQTYLKLQSLQIKMRSEEVAVQSAQKSYRAIKKRYENDKAILIELIQAQNRLSTSELSRALTKYDYLIQSAALEKQLGK